jgi:ribonuclease Z
MKNEAIPPLIYLPVEAEPFVKAYLTSHQEMSDCLKEADSQEGGKYKIDYVLRPTKPGEEIKFRQGGTDFIVRTLRMNHRIPCLGYSIFKLKQSLKEEYMGLPGKDIGRLRKEGFEVTNAVEEPFLCFFGDTTAATFSAYPDVLCQHRVVVIECSFIDDDSVKKAETTKHMHWIDLEPHIEKHPDTLFVLIHLSLKYSTRRLTDFFYEKKKRYKNIHPMIVDDSVKEQ